MAGVAKVGKLLHHRFSLELIASNHSHREPCLSPALTSFIFTLAIPAPRRWKAVSVR